MGNQLTSMLRVSILALLTLLAEQSKGQVGPFACVEGTYQIGDQEMRLYIGDETTLPPWDTGKISSIVLNGNEVEGYYYTREKKIGFNKMKLYWAFEGQYRYRVKIKKYRAIQRACLSSDPLPDVVVFKIRKTTSFKSEEVSARRVE